MMDAPSIATRIVVATFIALLAGLLAWTHLGGSADAAAASAMSIDVDPTGNFGAEIGIDCFDAVDNDGDTLVNDGCPSFSPPSESGAQCTNDTDDDSDTVVNDGCPQGPAVLGTIDSCIEVAAGATVPVDVVIEGIPPYVDNAPIGVIDASDTGSMTSFAFELTDDAAGDFTVSSQSFLNFLLAANTGSSLFDASDAPPSSDGVFTSSVLDSGAGIPEEGSGTLARISISVDGATPAGVYNLDLQNNAHGGPDGFFSPTVTHGGQIAVDASCPAPPADLEMTAVTVTSLSGSLVIAGSEFTIEVEGEATSNGPNPADIAITLDLAVPPDCTRTPDTTQIEAFASVGDAESRISTQTWTVNCSSPSDHQFDGSGSVAITGLANESNPANNGPVAGNASVAVEAEADLAMTATTVDAPTDAATGAPFEVTVTSTIHNLGTVDPLNADTTFDLAVPVNCSRVPDSAQTVEDTSLSPSVATMVEATWTVTCSTAGLQQFDGTATTSIDELHVTDPAPNNNDGQASDATDTSLGQADVKVTAITVSTVSSADVDTNFPVTVNTSVHNNGPIAPVNTDVTLVLNLPPDCFTPVDTILFEDAALGPSIQQMMPEVTFFVACIDHSFHDISATATIVIDDPLAGDPTPANNTASSATETVAIIRTADLKVSATVVTAPASELTNTEFDVTVDATVHNNGPDDAPGDVTITLTLPPDCSTPTNPVTILDVDLAASVPNVLAPVDFPVTCTDRSDHVFEATVEIAAPLHVDDQTPGNNTLGTNQATTALSDEADIKITGISLNIVATPTVNTPFDVTATADLHNNGPDGPANADATLSLSLPPDCATGDANPETVEDVTLNVSSAAQAPVTWSITCTLSSNHVFSADATLALDDIHVIDPNAGNNSGASGDEDTPVLAEADVKIISATVLAPPGFIQANTDVDITVEKVLHNNGLATPVDVTMTASSTPIAGCTVTPPPPSNHSLALSTNTIVNEVWTINCQPGTYAFGFENTLTVTTLHISDPAPANNSRTGLMAVTVDTDGDGVADEVETACGSDPGDDSSTPERVDGAFAGADEDGDTMVDEALPAGAGTSDCDRDGFTGDAETHIFGGAVARDQDPCGLDGWPLEIDDGTPPDSNNRINIRDLQTYILPLYRIATAPGDAAFDVRWDVVPGPGGPFASHINIADLSKMAFDMPPMLGGAVAFNGPQCPWPAS